MSTGEQSDEPTAPDMEVPSRHRWKRKAVPEVNYDEVIQFWTANLKTSREDNIPNFLRSILGTWEIGDKISDTLSPFYDSHWNEDGQQETEELYW
jgi:hypothetical protein